MNNTNFKSRSIDVVFCIDGTGSMTPCIDNIKNNAMRFYQELVSEITAIGNSVDMLRAKIITFRDYKSDGQEAMVESRFFELPDENEEFADHLKSIKAKGGCGEDANGLEALYYAMNSDFVTGINDRQVIVIFADTTAIPLKKRAKCPNYPKDMVDDDGLIETWMCAQSRPTKLRERNKRLVMFAPHGTIYEQLSLAFNRSVFEPVETHNGIDDVTFDDIIKLLAASASSV